MKIVNPSYQILTEISPGGIKELQHIERIGRTCYKSENKITPDGESAKAFVKMLIDRGHESMIEHSSLSVLFTVDRGITHEIVRHRVASYAQESTRYNNYSNGKYGSEITVVKPFYLDASKIGYEIWMKAMKEAEASYMGLLAAGMSAQEARAVLPTSLKAELNMTANYREWRHFLKLRCGAGAHPQIREICLPLLDELHERIPVVFDDVWEMYITTDKVKE